MLTKINKFQGEEVNYNAIIIDDIKNIEKLKLSKEEKDFAKQQLEDNKFITIDSLSKCTHIILLDKKKEHYLSVEKVRQHGHTIFQYAQRTKRNRLIITALSAKKEYLIALAEGFALSNYKFDKYKSKQKEHETFELLIDCKTVDNQELTTLIATLNATLWVRDLVNEPVNMLNATKLAECTSERIKSFGGKAEVLKKKQIESLKMGGLLAVNAGSVDEPTFTILEWAPKNAVNAQPIVLVGKGIVFDTGGYNLKPASYMDHMNDDMAGAATVAGIISAVAEAKLPVHVIALLPATDNRLSGNAHVTGDIITMYDGTTVEVLNTDAEGRLILADALAYAKKYDPLFVLDFATLTGAASRAIGPLATVVMQKNADKLYKSLEKCGFDVFERLVEFPMWEDYGDLIKSDIADIKNTGANFAGMIMAGKFLEHFTDYPWIHFDIAAPAFLESANGYIPKGGTGTMVRLVTHYLSSLK